MQALNKIVGVLFVNNLGKHKFAIIFLKSDGIF